jgi:ABC-2 type transport system permease protein
MRKTWAVVKREFGSFVGTKAYLLGTLFGPLALLVLMTLPPLLENASEPGERQIVVVDSGDRPAAREIAAELAPAAGDPEVASFRTEIARATETTEPLADLRRRVLFGELDGYVILPDSPEGAIVYEGRPGDFQAIARLRAAAERTVQRERLVAAGIDPDDVDRALAPVPFESRVIGPAIDRGEPSDRHVAAVFYLNTMMYIVILLYGISVLRSVQEEKERRVVEVLLSSLRPWQLMTGKVVGIGAAGLLQVAIWIAFAAIAVTLGDEILVQMGLTPPTLPPLPASLAVVVLLFFAGGYFLYASLYAALGAMAASWQDAQNLQFPALIILMAAFFTTFPVTESPESDLAVVTSLIPFTSPLIVPARSALGAMAWPDLVLPLAFLVLGCVVLLWIAGRVFRVTILATGSRPTPRRLWRWLRTG